MFESQIDKIKDLKLILLILHASRLSRDLFILIPPVLIPQALFINSAGARLGQFTDEVYRFRGLVVGDISLQKAMISSSVALWPSF